MSTDPETAGTAGPAAEAADRTCLMCAHAAAEDAMFDAGYGWYCDSAADCQDRQAATIITGAGPA